MSSDGAIRFTVVHGYVADEALWSSSSRFEDVAAKARLAWRMKDPIFKYKVPVTLSFGNNKTCSVVISDQQDYSVWYVGAGDTLNPKPFTATLTACERTLQRAVQPLQDKEYHIAMGHWATVSAQVINVLKPNIVLRHSACDDVILFDRPDLNGPSFGGWGRAVIKVRDAWHTRRPVFRYIDDSPTSGDRIYVSIIDAEDFSHWLRFRQPICRDLVVFDGADGEDFVPISSQMMNEVGTPNHKRSEYENALSAQYQAMRRMDESSKKPAHVVLASRFTAVNLQPAVGRGEFGPSFTTAAKPSGNNDAMGAVDPGAQQFEALVAKFAKK
jgi:hypothetical protein